MITTNENVELREYLQRVVGYCLLGKAPEKFLWFLYGPGATGKTTFLCGLLTAFGDYGAYTAFDTWTLGKREYSSHRGRLEKSHYIVRKDLTHLEKTRLVISDDAYESAIFDEDLLKTITNGGGRLTCARKHSGNYQFEIRFKLIIATNYIPAIRDETLRERIKLIPFDNVIPEQIRDPDFSLISSSGEAIMSWAVEGFRKYKERGFGTCEAVEKATAKLDQLIN